MSADSDRVLNLRSLELQKNERKTYWCIPRCFTINASINYHFYFQVKSRYCKIYVVILKKCGVVNVVPSKLRPIDGLSKIHLILVYFDIYEVHTMRCCSCIFGSHYLEDI